MGLLKGYFGQPKEAIELYKKAYKYALENNLLNSGDFTSILPNIASNFSRLHMPDSAFKYNNIAIKMLTTTPKILQVQHLLEGKIFWDQHAYQKSLDSYLKAMNYFSDENNFWLITNTYTKIGINYDSLKNPEKATKFHLKADSVYTLYNASSSYIKYSFQYLISYYKDLNNIKKQLEYTNKLLEVQKMNLEEEGQIQETFTNEFDIPNLLAERKKIIEQLDASSKRGTLIYSSLLIISIVVIMYLMRKKRSYKKRFLALVNKEHIVVNEPAKKNDTIEKSLISEEIVSEILTHLANFEKTLGFIDSSLNLKNLANQFNTNANYLSKVINQHKHTTFSNYIGTFVSK